MFKGRGRNVEEETDPKQIPLKSHRKLLGKGCAEEEVVEPLEGLQKTAGERMGRSGCGSA